MPTEILIILLLVVCVVILIVLIKSLKSANAAASTTPTTPATPAKTTAAPTPSVIYNMKTKQLPPQVTVYANPTNPNAFRCPVCDSRPEPSAKYCQVCGQVFQTMGGN